MKSLRAFGLIGALALVAEVALAQLVPWHSPFPRPRPTTQGAAAVPMPVPVPAPSTDGAVAQALESGASPLAVAVSPRPRVRPPAAAARFVAGLAAGGGGARAPDPVRTAARPTGGGLCGNPAIEGRTLNRIPGRLQGCGVAEPVSVTAVHGIALSQASTLDCETAQAVATYVGQVMVPTIGRRGGGLARVNIAAHYSCRTRNNRPGAPISEHGRGRAIDISGYRLQDGTTVTVLDDWRRRPHRSDLQEMYERACGIFTTTLGPDADRYHQDHFHFDRARHRNGGSYCP